MQFVIDIKCDGAAFDPECDGDLEAEIIAVLDRLTTRLQRNGVEDEIPLHDTNGNRVGTATLKG